MNNLFDNINYHNSKIEWNNRKKIKLQENHGNCFCIQFKLSLTTYEKNHAYLINILS